MSKTKFTKKELEHFKQLLLSLKENLIHDIRNMAASDEESRDVSGHVQHIADVATDMYEKEFNMGLASKDRELLVLIEAALKRIEDGTYGICLGSGEMINKERLEAIPYAEYSRDYQEKLESKKR